MSVQKVVAVAVEWQDAVTNRDLPRLLELSDPKIGIVGPRGTAEGHQILQDWFSRAIVSFALQRAFARDDRVVLAQHVVWYSTEQGEVIGDATVGSRFKIANGHVAEYERHDDLNVALAAAGLGIEDEVSATGNE